MASRRRRCGSRSPARRATSCCRCCHPPSLSNQALAQPPRIAHHARTRTRTHTDTHTPLRTCRLTYTPLPDALHCIVLPSCCRPSPRSAHGRCPPCPPARTTGSGSPPTSSTRRRNGSERACAAARPPLSPSPSSSRRRRWWLPRSRWQRPPPPPPAARSPRRRSASTDICCRRWACWAIPSSSGRSRRLACRTCRTPRAGSTMRSSSTAWGRSLR